MAAGETRKSVVDRVVLRFTTIDVRSLGIVRIAVGLVLLGDLAHRARWWTTLYGDDGYLPSAFAAGAAVRRSLFWAVHTDPQLAAVWVALGAIYLCVCLGLFTRLATVLAFVGWTSMSQRLWISTNTGYGLVGLVLMWSAFLPMGARFSLDAIRTSLARHPETRASELADRAAIAGPHRDEPQMSLAAVAVYLQIMVIYFCTAVTKHGPAWGTLTAVHHVLHTEVFASPFAALVRDSIPGWLYKAMAAATIGLEYTNAVATALPFVWTRRIAFAGILALHLNFGLLMVLGPFAWGCCCLAFFLVTPEDWGHVERALRRRHRARTVLIDEGDARSMRLARLLARLDSLALLTFEASSSAGLVSTRAPNGDTKTGREALGDVAAALPLGPLHASLWRSPLGGPMASAALALASALERLPPSKLFGSPGAVGLGATAREVLCAALIVINVAQCLGQNDLMRARFGYTRPAFVVRVGDTMNLTQGWQVFATPGMLERFTVVDAVTADGRHVDPLRWGRAPLERADGPLAREGLPQFGLDYTRRQFENKVFFPGMRHYVMGYGTRTGRPEDRIVSATAYLLTQGTPPFGQTEAPAPTRVRLWTTEPEDPEPGPPDLAP